MKKLGFGMMRLPVTEEGNPESIDQELFNQMVDTYLKNGFTYFDTAYPYHQGLSEVALRKAVVERYPREAFVIADKMPTFNVTSSDDYPKFFKEQLERCGVEYFDYYLLHCLNEKNYASTLENNGFEYMRRLKAEGKVKHIGFSFHDKAELLDTILTKHPEMEFVQLQINYIDWESERIESRKCYEVAVKHQKPVIVMEPVKGGSLANVSDEVAELFKAARPEMSMASWAIRYAASLDLVFMVLSGMSNMEQVIDNINCLQQFQPLSDDEQQVIGKAVDIINNSIAVPCTACRYCLDDCPKQIPIPRYFWLLNNQQQYRLMPFHLAHYAHLSKKFAKASDCLECKQCEQHCPQQIEIAEQLKEVAKIFEAQPLDQ